jgi:excisionase family DNA binding protein
MPSIAHRTKPSTRQGRGCRPIRLVIDVGHCLNYSLTGMIQANGIHVISPAEAARRLGVTPRRVYSLVGENRLRSERIGGRLLIDRDDVDARAAGARAVGRPLSPRRAWAMLLLADGQDPLGLDASTRSKLRRLLRERDLWSMRARFVGRAERLPFRAHSSDLPRIDAEPGVVRTGARHAAAAGLRLVASDARVELYVDRKTADRIVKRYRLAPSSRPNVLLRIVPDEVRRWLTGSVAPRPVMALDLAEDRDPRSQQVAREDLSPR